MKSLNLGILAHVDAGKTSLTERILFDAGARLRLGSVDSGNTCTDSLLLERERGITIKSAVASFELNHLLINLLDTPGTRISLPRWSVRSPCSTSPSSWCRPSRGSGANPGTGQRPATNGDTSCFLHQQG